ERRTRWIQTLTRAVDERLVGGTVHLIPRLILCRRRDDRVRVVVREAHRREDRAGARIERDHRAAPAGERVDGRLLHLWVDAEHDRAGRLALAEIARPPRRERIRSVLSDERIRIRRLHTRGAVLDRKSTRLNS